MTLLFARQKIEDKMKVLAYKHIEYKLVQIRQLDAPWVIANIRRLRRKRDKSYMMFEQGGIPDSVLILNGSYCIETKNCMLMCL